MQNMFQHFFLTILLCVLCLAKGDYNSLPVLFKMVYLDNPYISFYQKYKVQGNMFCVQLRSNQYGKLHGGGYGKSGWTITNLIKIVNEKQNK